jgi:hypothetical protein
VGNTPAVGENLFEFLFVGIAIPSEVDSYLCRIREQIKPGILQLFLILAW